VGKKMNTKIAEADDQFLTVEQLADRWQVTAQWIYSNHRALGVPKTRLGRKLRFEREKIRSWEQSRSEAD
jgi:predicted DNA-binding transcriptional regulator AlpA